MCCHSPVQGPLSSSLHSLSEPAARASRVAFDPYLHSSRDVSLVALVGTVDTAAAAAVVVGKTGRVRRLLVANPAQIHHMIDWTLLVINTHFLVPSSSTNRHLYRTRSKDFSSGCLEGLQRYASTR